MPVPKQHLDATLHGASDDRNPSADKPLRFRRRRERFNPRGLHANRFESKPYLDVERLGQSPGTQDLDTRADRQQHATIRRLWRQTVSPVAAPAALSWTANAPSYSFGIAFQVTRALRYMASTRYKGAGTYNSRFGRPRPAVRQARYGQDARATAGTRQRRPVIRNRITSFGSRVKPLNRRMAGAEREES